MEKILSRWFLRLAVTRGRAKRISSSRYPGTQLGHLQTVAAVIATMCLGFISSSSAQKCASCFLPELLGPGAPAHPGGDFLTPHPFLSMTTACSDSADRDPELLIRPGPQRRGRRQTRDWLEEEEGEGRPGVGWCGVVEMVKEPERSRFKSQLCHFPVRPIPRVHEHMLGDRVPVGSWVHHLTTRKPQLPPL